MTEHPLWVTVQLADALRGLEEYLSHTPHHNAPEAAAARKALRAFDDANAPPPHRPLGMSGGVPAGELREFASLMVDEVIAKVRIQLDAGQSLSVADQRLMLDQLIKDRERLHSLTPTPPSRDADVERWHSRKIVECEFRLGDCVRCGKRGDRLNQRDPCFQPAGRHGHPLHPEVRAAVVSMGTQRSAIWAKARQFGLSAEESADLALDAVATARAALQALGERP